MYGVVPPVRVIATNPSVPPLQATFANESTAIEKESGSTTGTGATTTQPLASVTVPK